MKELKDRFSKYIFTGLNERFLKSTKCIVMKMWYVKWDQIFT